MTILVANWRRQGLYRSFAMFYFFLCICGPISSVRGFAVKESDFFSLRHGPLSRKNESVGPSYEYRFLMTYESWFPLRSLIISHFHLYIYVFGLLTHMCPPFPSVRRLWRLLLSDHSIMATLYMSLSWTLRGLKAIVGCIGESCAQS